MPVKDHHHPPGPIGIGQPAGFGPSFRTPGPLGRHDAGDPRVLNAGSEYQAGTHRQPVSDGDAPYDIRLTRFDAAEIGIECQSFDLKAEPVLDVLDVHYDGSGFDHAYLYHFFTVKAKIDWTIVGHSDAGDELEAQFSTEFQILYTKKSLLLLSVLPSRLSPLKWAIFARDAMKAVLEELPLVIEIRRFIRDAVVPACQGSAEFEKDLRTLFDRFRPRAPRIDDGRA